MKANPGKVTFVNQTAAAQVAGLLLQQLTGTKVSFIPYRGAGPAMTDLIAGPGRRAGRAGRGVALPQVRAGTIKAIANLSPRRSRRCPTFRPPTRAGARALHASGWFGLFAPKGTPTDVIAKLNAAMVAGARRSRRARALRRPRARHRAARAADARRPRRLPQGRDREMVADHQGRRHQGGVRFPARTYAAGAAVPR